MAAAERRLRKSCRGSDWATMVCEIKAGGNNSNTASHVYLLPRHNQPMRASVARWINVRPVSDDLVADRPQLIFSWRERSRLRLRHKPSRRDDHARLSLHGYCCCRRLHEKVAPQ